MKIHIGTPLVVGLTHHLTRVTGYVLLTFGVASIVSIFLVGALIDRHTRMLTLVSAGRSPR